MLVKKLAANKIDTSALQSSRILGAGKRSHPKAPFEASKQWETESIGSDENASSSTPKLPESDSDEFNGFDTDEDEIVEEQLFDLASSSLAIAAPTVANIPTTSTRLISAAAYPTQSRTLDAEGNPVMRKRRRLTSSTLQSAFDPESYRKENEVSTRKVESLASSYEALRNDKRHSVSDSDPDSEDTDLPKENANLPGSTDASTDQADNQRSIRFQSWAAAQGDEPHMSNIDQLKQIEHLSYPKTRTRADDIYSDAESITANETSLVAMSSDKSFYVPVTRAADIFESRLKLPVVAEEQRIMEAINKHSIVIIWGATGSGKSTQIPQFLVEAGYGTKNSPMPGKVCITQPRRVATVSTANRVRYELQSHRDLIAYRIRFENTSSESTILEYVTDGILLREIQQDFLLKRFSAIIIDEAHERTTNTDLLIGMLSRIVVLRESMKHEEGGLAPLRLIIMSATPRIAELRDNPKLFRDNSPPVIQIEGRQFPVTVHFARTTQRDYLAEIHTKICKGHQRLPGGTMLVFLTGKQEIQNLSDSLHENFELRSQLDESSPKRQRSSYRASKSLELNTPLDDDLLDSDVADSDDDRVDRTNDDDEASDPDFNDGEIKPIFLKVRILQLHAQLPTEEQLRVFESPRKGTRLIVLATNVAETSLTIPGVRYVFDCGRAKEKKYNPSTGVHSFEVGWISKASAEQRMGRAGRTGPGHCYRMYSSAIYESEFKDYTDPEIVRNPTDGVVLQLKNMLIDKVAHFPFPTPPDGDSLVKAERLLCCLGALDQYGRISETGKQMAMYPLAPRLSKMLVYGQTHRHSYSVIELVATISVSNLFASDIDTNPAARQSVNARFGKVDKLCDAFKLVAAMDNFVAAARSSRGTALTDHCRQNHLNQKQLNEANLLLNQLLRIAKRTQPESPNLEPEKKHSYWIDITSDNRANVPPTKKSLQQLKEIIASGFIDNIAIRADLAPNLTEDLPPSPKRATDVPYLTISQPHERQPRARMVFIHPTSLMSALQPTELPQYIIYHHLQYASPKYSSSEKRAKIRMHPLTDIDDQAIFELVVGTPLVTYDVLETREMGEDKKVGDGTRVVQVRPFLVAPGEVWSRASKWPLKTRVVKMEKDQRGKWQVKARVE